MSGGPLVSVQGAKTLRATLKAAGIKLDDLKAAHAAVATLVWSRAAPRTPTRTGRLGRTGRPSGQQGAAIVRVGTAAVPYGGPIHWGWANRHIVAQPWIYVAAGDTQQTWEPIYLAAIEAVIAEVEGTPGP